MPTSVRSPFQQGLWSACVVLAVASAAWGNLTTVQVTGVVDSSSFESIVSGSAVRGFYTYDDALAPDVHPSTYGTYAWYSPVSGRLFFDGGSSIGTDVGGLLVNNHSGGDEYGVYLDASGGRGTWTGAFVGKDWTFAIPTILRHGAPTAWDVIELPDPETVLGLLPLDSSEVYFFEESYGTHESITFHVTDLSVVAVPLPGAIVLGAIGLACCRPLLRRRAR